MTKKEYFREYMRLKRRCEYCIYCDYYCTQRDKHYTTIEHLNNISKQLNLNINLLKK
jgi:hypothetical protein